MIAEQRRLDELVGDILTAIDRINDYVSRVDEKGFLSRPMIQDAVIRNFEVIGEAGRAISTRFPEFAAANPGLALSDAYGMRNVLAHGYFRVDLLILWKTIHSEILWKTIHSELPRMRALLAPHVRRMADEKDKRT